MRYRDRSGQDWADIIDFLIDFLTMYPDAAGGATVGRRSTLETALTVGSS
jgi:hypothetical protein